MMRKTAALLFAVGLGMTACSTDTDLSDRPLFSSRANVYQVHVIDGTTGALVEGAKVQLQVGVYTLSAEDQGGGFYVLDQIPNGTFPVMVTASGYKAFANTQTFSGTNNNAPTFLSRNLVVFPDGNVAENLTVSVYAAEDGAAVAGATVVAQLVGASALVATDSTYLFPNSYTLPAVVTALTDTTTGQASIPGTSLLLGGEYEINVFNAVDAAGSYLVERGSETVVAGEDILRVEFFMDLPGKTPVAVKVNNEDGAIHSTLEVTFPYPVEKCNEDNYDWTNWTGTSAVPATTNPVTATLNSAGNILTLVYNVEAGTDLGTDARSVRFDNIEVKVKGASDGDCTLLQNIRIRDGAFIDRIIDVRIP